MPDDKPKADESPTAEPAAPKPSEIKKAIEKAANSGAVVNIQLSAKKPKKPRGPHARGKRQ